MQVCKTIKTEEVIKFNEITYDLVIKTIEKLEERFSKKFVYENGLLDELIGLEQAIGTTLNDLKEALNE